MPKWPKGQSGNPHGAPRKPEIELMRQAIVEVCRRKKKSLWVHVMEQFFEDNNVMIAVLKKLLPDKLIFFDSDETSEEKAKRYENVKKFLLDFFSV